jgi:phytoene dehydrogenase-like protein
VSTDVIVIGAGANELVCAHYLARAGHRVTLVRESSRFDDPAPTSGWVPPHVISALQLDRHGFQIERPEPWLAVSLPGGKVLTLSRDVERSVEAIRELSPADAARWPQFCERMHVLARVLESMYSAPPPDPFAPALGDKIALARSALRVRRLGKETVHDLLRLTAMPIADLLDEWFENDVLKGALGASGVMNLAAGPRSGGTVFNFLHHHVGCARGVFREPRSNVHAVLSALHGIDLRDGTLERVSVANGRVNSVVLSGGEEIVASIVVSGAHPKRTLLELVDPGWLEPELVRAVRNIRSRGVAARIDITLDGDPGFSRVALASSLDDIERAYDATKYGNASRAPYVEATHFSDSGRHKLHVHVQYVPYESESDPQTLARDALARLAQAVPKLSSSIVEQCVHTPRVLESAHDFPEGQPYQAELALDQIFWMRPAPALARYRTPLRGLYLCGAAMHPGSIAGVCGANAAQVVLRDLRRKRGER